MANPIIELYHKKRSDAERLERDNSWDYSATIAAYRREAYQLIRGLREALTPRLNFHRFKDFDSAWRQFVREYLEEHPEYDPSSTQMTRAMVNDFGRWLYRRINPAYIKRRSW